MSHVHSPYKIADQLAFSLHLTETLDSLQPNLMNMESENVLSFLGLSPEKNKSGRQILSNSYIVGIVKTSVVSSQERDSIEELAGPCPMEAPSFDKVFHNDTLFHTIEYGHADSKRNSTVCSYSVRSQEHYGIINRFYLINSIPIAIIQPLTVQG